MTTPEFGGDTDVDTGTPPFDLESGIEVNVLDFPNANEYLQDLLNGQFEFPVEDEGSPYVLSIKRSQLIGELQEEGIKHTPENIVVIDKTPEGKIVFLEKGDSRAGLKHIVERHGAEFANKGISEDQIPDVIISALTEGKIVGEQSEDRSIYETTVDGKIIRIAITVGSNGFIVGANISK